MTLVFSRTLAPRERAPAARAWVTSIGLTCPSFGQEDAARDILHVVVRQAFLDLARRDHLHVEAEVLGHGGAAHQLLKAAIGQRDRDRAVLLEAGGLAGFLLEALEEAGGVLGEFGQVARGAELTDEAGGMPGGAGGELLALQQDHIGDALLGQVIGNRAADNAAADDHDIGARGQGLGHGPGTPDRGGEFL